MTDFFTPGAFLLVTAGLLLLVSIAPIIPILADLLRTLIDALRHPFDVEEGRSDD